MARKLAPIFTKERARQDRAIARRNRILELKRHERHLIAAAKDARARGQRLRFNDLKQQLVLTRERVRQAGGKPEVRPLARDGGRRAPPSRGGVSARQPARGGRATERRPSGGGRREEDVYAPIPDDEDADMPGDVDEDEAGGDDWLPFGVDPTPAAPVPKRGIFDFLKPDPAKVAARKAAAAQRRAAAQAAAQARRAGRKPPVTKIGPNMAITTRPGYRAAVTEFRPGLYVVAEVPQAAVAGFGDDEVGILPLLAPLVITAVATEAQRRQQEQAQSNSRRQRQLTGPAASPSVAGILGVSGDAVPRWVDAQVAGEVMGCDGRPCNCGK